MGHWVNTKDQAESTKGDQCLVAIELRGQPSPLPIAEQAEEGANVGFFLLQTGTNVVSQSRLMDRCMDQTDPTKDLGPRLWRRVHMQLVTSVCVYGI